jgi:hypothetical protein
MAVWLGNAGGIRLERAGGERVYTTISPSDVDIGSKRFGFDRPITALISGDAVWIRRVDGEGRPIQQPLSFVGASGWSDGTVHPDGRWYAHADGMGSVRLYRNWDQAIAGRVEDAIELKVPPDVERVSIDVEAAGQRDLAQTVSWELNTNREVADVSSLGDGFRKQQGTMVSGSGELDCLWDLGLSVCDPEVDGRAQEVSIYLHRLILRQEIGARFKGVFLLKTQDARPLNSELDSSIATAELFYACDCVVTEVVCRMQSNILVQSKIKFVTTGPIQLLYGWSTGYLLQQNQDRILQQSGFGILL